MGSRAVGRGPLAPFQVLWRHRVLLGQLARREIEGRYRGSVLGLLWTLIAPLVMLAVYTFVFSEIFQARWSSTVDSRGVFALLLFSGLILFNLFAEPFNRAPGLMLENVSYIKKVVFPLEVLPLVTMAGALFNAGVGFLILFAFYVPVLGWPPVTCLWLPVVILPLVLVTAGVAWFLAALGVFLRDLRQIAGLATTILMFLSPIFYPLEAIPERFRGLLLLNPLTIVLEESKAVLFWGHPPDWALWAASTGVAWLVAWLGFLWFTRTSRSFADVV